MNIVYYFSYLLPSPCAKSENSFTKDILYILVILHSTLVFILLLPVVCFCRMQVEVSKYTEGVIDKALRPNGLPKSLIRYDGSLSDLIKLKSFHDSIIDVMRKNMVTTLIYLLQFCLLCSQLVRRRQPYVPLQRLSKP